MPMPQRKDQNLWIGEGTIEECGYKDSPDKDNRPFVVRMKITEIGADNKHYTEYINVVAWRNRAAEMHCSLEIGDRIHVTGRFYTKSVGEGADRRYYSSIYCHTFANMTPKAPPKEEEEKQIPFDDSPIPF